MPTSLHILMVCTRSCQLQQWRHSWLLPEDEDVHDVGLDKVLSEKELYNILAEVGDEDNTKIKDVQVDREMRWMRTLQYSQV